MRAGLLSKEAVRHTIEPYLDRLGPTDRARLVALIDLIQEDGRIRLSDALDTLYSHPDSYDVVLSAFRQFRLRLKKLVDEQAPFYFLLKSDTQTRAKPDMRWCWFEGERSSVKSIALFSSYETKAVNRITHPIQQMAMIMKLNDHMLTSDSQKVVAPSGQEGQRYQALECLEKWLLEKRQSYCAVLGEYGMGKTTTCMLFTQQLLEQRTRNPALPLPIYMDLRNLGDKEQLDDIGLPALIDRVLKNSVYAGLSENILDAKEIIRLVREEGALAIFDGLDEVLVRLSSSAGQHFTRKLLSILPHQEIHENHVSVGRVLLTCRTHYFRTLREQKALLTGDERSGILASDYCVLMLLPLTSEHIRNYLTQSLPGSDIETLLELIRSVHNLSELTERPYTLSLISDLVPQIQQWKAQNYSVTGASIYRHMVLSWLERDSGRHRLTAHHKLQLMEYFAADLWRSGKQVWTVANIENGLVHFLSSHPEIETHYFLGQDRGMIHHVLEALKGDLRAATFLVRVSDQGFRFAHTSLHEFFLAAYLHRALIDGCLEAWDMPLVSRETLDFLGQLLSDVDGGVDLALATLQIIRNGYRPRVSEQAFAYMLRAHIKGYPSPTLVGIHLEGAYLEGWSIVGEPNKPLDFQNALFCGANLEGANFHYLNLQKADFSKAQLMDVEFSNGNLQSSCFKNANLESAEFRDMALQNSDFDGANLLQTYWVRCRLEGASGFGSSASGLLFGSCEPPYLLGVDDQCALDNGSALWHGHSCSFSSDGLLLASTSLGNSIKIWEMSTKKSLNVLYGHQDWVTGCAFFPDGVRLLSASADQTLRIWDIRTGQCLKVLEGHQGGIRKCAVSPDGKLAASASLDKTLRVWDISTGQCLHILSDHSDWVRSCAFSPTKPLLVSASEDRVLRVWDIGTGQCIQVFTGHESWVRGCTFSPNGELVISASGDKTLRLWDVATGKCLRVFMGHSNRVRDCAFSPSGEQLISVSDDQTLRIWDTFTGKCVNTLNGHYTRVKSCAFSPNGMWIASAADDHALRLWDAATGECVCLLEGLKN